MEFLIYVAIGGLVIWGVVSQFKHYGKMKSQNYDWYKKQHPDLVNNGIVSCNRCAASNVGVERVMNQTYMRRHFCRQCGSNLYYSPEE